MFVGLNLDTGELVATADIDPRSDPIGHPPMTGLPTEDPLERWFRDHCQAKRLVCEGCKGALVFRRGRLKEAHLAHEAEDSACSHAQKTKPLHMSAAVTLYRWLKAKLDHPKHLVGWSAQIEVRLEEENIPRPLDVRLREPAGEGGFGYLLVSRRFSWKEREAWDGLAGGRLRGLHRVGLDRRFKFVVDGAELEKEAPLPPSEQAVQVRLAPQELWAVQPSRHAVVWHHSPAQAAELGGPQKVPLGGAISFLLPVESGEVPLAVPERWEVVSFRLRTAVSSGLFEAVILRNPLPDMHLRPRDGALFHPQEHERLVEWTRQAEEEAERLHRRRESERLRRHAEAREAEARARARRKAERLSERMRPRASSPAPSAFTERVAGPRVAAMSSPPEPEPESKPKPKPEAEPKPVPLCVQCGRFTDDLWMHDPVTNTGKCRQCLKERAGGR